MGTGTANRHGRYGRGTCLYCKKFNDELKRRVHEERTENRMKTAIIGGFIALFFTLMLLLKPEKFQERQPFVSCEGILHRINLDCDSLGDCTDFKYVHPLNADTIHNRKC